MEKRIPNLSLDEILWGLAVVQIIPAGMRELIIDPII